MFIPSQYLFDKYAVNPAVAGTMSYNPISFTYRKLWTGIDDAPKESSFSTHFALTDHVGTGCKIYSFVTGPLARIGIEMTYAYHVPLNSKGLKLSLGLSGMLNQYSINKDKITLEDPNDAVLLKSVNTLIVPDAIFGAYLYDKKFYMGLSSYQLFNRKVDMMNTKLQQRQVRHYFYNIGYIYSINRDVKIEPSVLLKMIEAGVFQYNFDVMCTFNKIFSLGFAYRSEDALIFMFNIGKKNRISFGYSYDVTLSEIKKYSRGSHEIMITYKFKSIKSQFTKALF